jgi:hypothetical protein
VILGARVLGEFWDDPNRYTTAKVSQELRRNLSIDHRSDRKRAVLARNVRNKRLYDALDQWAFCALTRSPGTRTFYDQHRTNGDEQTAWAHRTPKAA